MEISVKKVVELIEKQEYFFTQELLTLSELKKNNSQLIEKAIDDINDKYQKNGLALLEYQISDLADLKISFFSNIINLPYEYSKKYEEFFPNDALAELKFYFSVSSPYVNRSNLWIEEIKDHHEVSTKIMELLADSENNFKDDEDSNK